MWRHGPRRGGPESLGRRPGTAPARQTPTQWLTSAWCCPVAGRPGFPRRETPVRSPRSSRPREGGGVGGAGHPAPALPSGSAGGSPPGPRAPRASPPRRAPPLLALLASPGRPRPSGGKCGQVGRSGPRGRRRCRRPGSGVSRAKGESRRRPGSGPLSGLMAKSPRGGAQGGRQRPGSGPGGEMVNGKCTKPRSKS